MNVRPDEVAKEKHRCLENNFGFVCEKLLTTKLAETATDIKRDA
jgi:hypothetical protein